MAGDAPDPSSLGYDESGWRHDSRRSTATSIQTWFAACKFTRLHTHRYLISSSVQHFARANASSTGTDSDPPQPPPADVPWEFWEQEQDDGVASSSSPRSAAAAAAGSTI